MKRAFVAILPIVFVASVAALGYAWLQRTVADQWTAADAADRAGQTADALERYERLMLFLQRSGWLKQHFGDAYTDAALSRLRLLHEAESVDKVLALSDQFAEDAGVLDRAAVHFWTGTALVERGLRERKNEEALPWFNRALSQLKRALEVDDAGRWNIKYNYELVRAVIDRATREPEQPPPQILRRQQESKPAKKIVA
ncbi:MAG: hypothetical protein IT176_09845 [Acidobacteria bacterium]|nr:hypothetical protein [Acidobacteriota bacterium]